MLPRIALAGATLFLAACSAMVSHPKPTAAWAQRTGQVKISSAKTSIVADIVIRNDANNFLAEISKGPGLSLLKLSASFAKDPGGARYMREVKATGPLARGGWTLKTHAITGQTNPNAKIHSRPWAALPEVFQWGASLSRREKFQLRLPDLTQHATVSGGRLLGFDYRVHDNSTNRVLSAKELEKAAVAGSVVCILDK